MSDQPQTRAQRRAAEREQRGNDTTGDGASSRKAQRRAAATQAARRRQRVRWIGGGTVVVVVVIIAIALFLSQASSSSATGLTDPNALNPGQNLLKVGSAAPNFTAATVDGTRHSLASERGHTVLLEFFAVWCPNCQAEAPILNQLEQKYSSKGLRALAVLANPYGRNYDDSGRTDLRLADKGDMTWFKNTFAVTHPLLYQRDFAAVNQYGANSYPTIYVIDRNGKIVSATQGTRPLSELSGYVDKALKA